MLLSAAVGGYFIGTGKINLYQKQTTQDSKSATGTASVSTDETVSWKTYTNTKYGFSFKYPKNLEGFQYGQNQEYVRLGYPGPSDETLFYIAVYDSVLSPDEWWYQIGKNKYPWLFDVRTSKSGFGIVNGSVDATRVVGLQKVGDAVLNATLFLVGRKGYVMVIEDNTYGSDIIFKYSGKTMLHTLKFLDQK